MGPVWFIIGFSVKFACFSQAACGKAFIVINAGFSHRNPMSSWQQIEETLRQIINTSIRFIKARRREEAAITAGAILIWAGIYFPELLEKVGLKELSWKGDMIGRRIFIAVGAGSVLYAAFKIFRLVYVPDLPPPQDRPSAIKGPMAFTEDDGALFRKLGRENDLQKLLGLILDNQVVMVIVRGASGAGKTSLLRAGLTHILAEKGVKYHYWEARPTEPDKWLLHAIRETWPGDSTKPSTLDELVNLSDKLCRQAHVIVLDQFEQLRGSKSIFRLLRRIAREAKPPHRVTWVIAFREEFSKDWMDFIWPELEREVRPPRDLPLRLFTPEQAREVISQLVNESRLSAEQAVVDNLVEAATVEGEVSPVDIGIGLLALAELGERRGRKTVTIRDYQFAGGAEGLLTQYVSSCLELFPKEDRETILKAMLALRDSETHQRIAVGLGIDELAKEAGAEARLLKPKLDRLAQRDVRLLEIVTTPAESAPRYRLPHDRLILAIHRLTGKLLAEVDQARLKFENAFLAWQKNGERSRYLMRGADLRLVERFEAKIPWGRDAQEEQRFLNRSKRRRCFVKLMAAALVLALIGSGWLASLRDQRLEAERFLGPADYPPGLYDWQHQLRKLALNRPLNLGYFNWLFSDSIEELELSAEPSSNSIAGLASLSRCRSLKKLTLHFGNTYVNDLEPLSKLSDLTHLWIDLRDSGVRDLKPLSKLNNLTHLTLLLDGSLMSDLEPLSKVDNLTLDLSFDNVRDLEPLSKLNNRTQLSLILEDRQVSALESLLKLGNLTLTRLSLVLRLRDRQVTNWEPLLKVSNLTLDLRSSQVRDLEPLSKLSNLPQLSLILHGNQVRDLETLSKLSHLTQLSLDFQAGEVSDLELILKMSNLTRLTQLSLTLSPSQMSALEAISKLSNLPHLTQLSLGFRGDQVSDLTPLLKLSNLPQLSLTFYSDQVRDLTPLSELSNRTQLSLAFYGIQVRDLEQVLMMPHLRTLSIEGNREQRMSLRKIPASLDELKF